MDELMKIVGIRYLHETLRTTIEQVLSEHKTCEIDPSRFKDGDSLATNMANLKIYITSTFRSITSSALRCPQLMCEIFSVLKELAIKYFPESREVCYYVISGFVFLRFFAPAILNPKLFEITDQQISNQVIKEEYMITLYKEFLTEQHIESTKVFLELISSSTTLSVPRVNELPVLLKESNQVIKEEYMITLYKEFLTEQHIESTKVFLELISSSTTLSVPRVNELPVLLKESVMTKRAQGRRRIGIAFRNFKKRYFCLNTQHFFYSKTKNKRPLCRIPINEILAVEKLQEQSFKMKNMFQVVRKDRALYIQASNCVEEKEWIDILTKVCQTNRNRLKEYHPSAFIGGQWLCCKAPNENTSGCCPVTVTSLPPDLGVHIDPDREIERIHTIFLQNMENLETLIELCEKQHLQQHHHHHNANHHTHHHNANSARINAMPTHTTNPYNNRMPHFVIEDRHTLWETLKELRQCVIRLEQNHKQYMRSVCVRTIYGSEQAPIGDDNYLLMLAKHCTT
ncbi:unnamed protein product [Medioppia subpectinata]|uniref:Ras GTPase-activating protein n=1 Tax=Medioppia subpectinata TaxID=1979941 RepID=A0A7R9KRG9_9ACAR|nr:unnamed protein product [Medioppia subpectinata]CAG2107098.1 unnamed protein product [Medioppia subpectinata]